MEADDSHHEIKDRRTRLHKTLVACSIELLYKQHNNNNKKPQHTKRQA